MADKHEIISLPGKLPMIVNPKFYKRDKAGGYLLNDVNTFDHVLIKKLLQTSFYC